MKKIYRAVSRLLVISILLSLLVETKAAYAVEIDSEVNNGNQGTENIIFDLEGDGTEESPYIIRDYEDFTKVKEKPSAIYKLTADIDVAENNYVWESFEFSGKIYGNKFVIYNIHSFNGKIGIFSKLENAEIQDLYCILDTEINIPEINSNAGIIAAEAYNSKFTGCYVNAIIKVSCDNLGGIVGKGKNCIIEQCMTEGDFKNVRNGYVVSTGGIIGEMIGGEILNSYTNVNAYSETNGYVHADASVGGIAGIVTAESLEKKGFARITNCLIVGNTDNCSRGSRYLAHMGGIFGSYFIGPFNDAATIQNSFYDKTNNALNYKENNLLWGRSTEDLVFENTYEGWDFVSIWKIDANVNNGYPYLRNIEIDRSSLEGEERVIVEHSFGPANNSTRVNIDQMIVVTFQDEIELLNTEEIYAREIKSGEYTELKIDLLTEKCLMIFPKTTWKPYTEYEIVIPKGTYSLKKTGQAVTNRDVYRFTTNMLSGTVATFSLPNDFVSKDYMGSWITEDKSVPPFPSETMGEYIKEFRNWAENFGYKDNVDKLNDSQIEEILDMEFSSVVKSEDEELYLETGTNKTVKEVMQDLLMIQYMKEYLIKEENRISSNATTEDLEDSMEIMNDYYQRLLEYYGKFEGTRYDAMTAYYILLDFSSLFSYFDLALPQTTSKFTGELLNLEKIRLEIDKEKSELINSTYSANNSNEKTINSAKKIKELIDNGSTLLGKNDIWEKGKVVVEVFGIKDFFEDKISDFTGIDKSSHEWYVYSEIIDRSVNVLGSISKNGAGFLASVSLLKSYMDMAISYYSYVENQYPVWLFYSNYYMKLAAPDAYNNIWGRDDDYCLELGQGLFTIDAYEDEEDSIVKLLMNPLCENNSSLTTSTNIYTYQNNYSKTHNVNAIIDAAEYLGSIRVTDQKSAGEVLIRYAIEKYMTSKSEILTCEIACPTDVQVIDNMTGDIVFTLKNDMKLERNLYDFGSVYLLEENRDVKYLRLNEGYQVNIIATDDGIMNCTFSKKIGEQVLNEVEYEDLIIRKGEKYHLVNETLALEQNKTVVDDVTISVGSDAISGVISTISQDDLIESEEKQVEVKDERVEKEEIETDVKEHLPSIKDDVLEKTDESIQKENMGYSVIFIVLCLISVVYVYYRKYKN